MLNTLVERSCFFGIHFYSDGDSGSYYYDGDEEYGKYSEYSDQYNLYQGRRLKMQVTKVPGYL